jgi:hypothetical protein
MGLARRIFARLAVSNKYGNASAELGATDSGTTNVAIKGESPLRDNLYASKLQ